MAAPDPNTERRGAPRAAPVNKSNFTKLLVGLVVILLIAAVALIVLR